MEPFTDFANWDHQEHSARTRHEIGAFAGTILSETNLSTNIEVSDALISVSHL